MKWKCNTHVTHTLEGLFPTTRARESIYKGRDKVQPLAEPRMDQDQDPQPKIQVARPQIQDPMTSDPKTSDPQTPQILRSQGSGPGSDHDLDLTDPEIGQISLIPGIHWLITMITPDNT